MYDFISDLENLYYDLSDSYSSLKVYGNDAKRFLNGQLTNDIYQLKEGDFQLQCRLDRNGRVLTFCYLLDAKSFLIILVPHEDREGLKHSLEKFIIMDDVIIENYEQNFNLIFHPYFPYKEVKDSIKGGFKFKGSFGFLPCTIMSPEMSVEDKARLKEEEFINICLLRAAPIKDISCVKNILVTDTVISLSAVSLKKGCFLGQETVSKIESRKGAAYFPMLLESEKDIYINENQILKKEGKKVATHVKTIHYKSKVFHLMNVARNYRVRDKNYTFELNDSCISGVMRSLPLGGEFSFEDYLDHQYELAISCFNEDKLDKSIKILKEIIEICPKHEDAIESLGVIYGRISKYEEGIQLMDNLLKVNQSSIMAHTNKSLFYMKLGKIEEAEEEKAKATVKTFTKLGEEGKTKKNKELEEKKKEQELKRKEEMFLEVLEIDPEDELAKYGLADVYFKKNKYLEAVPLLREVLNKNPYYSVAYLLLGKCLLKTDKDEAKKVFEKGIEVASGQGDMMPANEMQSKLLDSF